MSLSTAWLLPLKALKIATTNQSFKCSLPTLSQRFPNVSPWTESETPTSRLGHARKSPDLLLAAPLHYLCTHSLGFRIPLKDYLCCLQFQKEKRRITCASGQLWIRMYLKVSLCVRKQICIIRTPTTTVKSSFMNDTKEL